MSPRDKPLVWLRGEIKTPPFGPDARLEAGFLLRRLQRGELLGLPHSRPMPSVGSGCHELRIVDANLNWRIMYHIATEGSAPCEELNGDDWSGPAGPWGTLATS